MHARVLGAALLLSACGGSAAPPDPHPAPARWTPQAIAGGALLSGPALGAVIDEGGAHIGLAGSEATFRATAIGRAGALVPVDGAAAPVIAGGDVRTHRGALTEWWRAVPEGLEHGLDVGTRPPGEGALVVEVRVTGDYTLTTVSDTAIALAAAGATASYDGLVVEDADGRRLPARMAADGDVIRFHVDDTSARYPLVIDPVVGDQEAMLVTPTPAAGDSTGTAVAMTADGARVVVGSPEADTAVGSHAGMAHVFVRTGTTWALEARLVPSMGIGMARFGRSVDISDDGSVVVVGMAANVGSRFATVFRRTGSTWSEEAVLDPATDAFGARTAEAVAISGDGARVLVGSPGDTRGGFSGAGSVTVFRRAAAWVEDTVLVAPDPDSFDGFGETLALDATGVRAAIGVPQDGSGAGSVRVFLRGAGWSQEAVLTGSATTRLGSAVAMSDDGSRVVTTHNTSSTPGAIVFVRSGAWSAESTLPVAGAPPIAVTSVAISGDGTRALAGVPALVVTHAFSRGATWTSEAALRLAGGAPSTNFGVSAAMSRTGNRAAIGASGDTPVTAVTSGSVRVFRLSALGAPCTTDADCAPNVSACIDGVCCSAACAACEACSIAAGGSVDGTCTAMSAPAAAARICRPASGACDVADSCTGADASGACPTDVRRAAGTTCRASGGPCDAAEVCDGSSGACPGDVRSPLGSVCRSAAGPCDVAEVCDGIAPSCPPDGFRPASDVCNPFRGVCDVEDRCTGTSAACPDTFLTGTVCHPATGPCDVAEVCDGTSVSCPSDVVRPAGTLCAAAAGACDAPDTCNGSTGDCPAAYLADVECRPSRGVCDPAEFCGGASPNCPIDARTPAGIVCRSVAGPCDVGEACDGSSPACPTDAFANSAVVCRDATGPCDAVDRCPGTTAACPDTFLTGSVCRGAAGPCDLPEECDGAGVTCPSDAVRPIGTLCASASGVCDADDECNGITVDCPAIYLRDVACRPAAGACDLAESCSGSSPDCPSDALVPSGIACGGATGASCSTPGTCNGAQPTCPGASPLPAGTVCLAAAGAPCDVDDVCDGISDACQPAYQRAGTVCGEASGVCDAADTCSGTSADCEPRFLSGVECRASSGACDLAEVCLGSSPDCPPDALSPASTVCRASTDLACDPLESCDGVSGGCPADENTCSDDAGPVDAGVGAADTSPSADAGGPAPVAGCACTVAGRARLTPTFVLLLALALVRRRLGRAR